MDFIKAIEEGLGKKALMDLLPLQAGDVPASHADISDLMEATGYKPSTKVEDGVANFLKWYKKYYS